VYQRHSNQEPPLQLFTSHPASVDETYLQHMRVSLTFFAWLSLAASAALMHAFLPFLFEKTGSGIIKRLYARIHNR
jgi:hypothetical protein